MEVYAKGEEQREIPAKISITTDHFHEYLITLGLFRSTIKVDEAGSFIAVVSPKPRLEDFTQVYHQDGHPADWWTVRLSRKDIFNASITKNFFQVS